MYPTPLFPSRQVLFVLGTLLFGVFIFAFVWYIQYTVFASVQSVGSTVISDLGTNSTTQGYVDTFLVNMSTYCGVLGLLALCMWAWMYSQKRGIEV